ncbi:uncharacterized protein LOC114539642 [Dendronephthya gigantea]|uniref:uncharacterized protein LOC114539642 n=1 Tax=Dendronephthya gigantea TaxID=151771 RepID=UPI00106BD37D|nr:uncharacterized protein LOC114539642 [Dendronephthya gigantea]
MRWDRSGREYERNDGSSASGRKYGQQHGTASTLIASERKGNCAFCLKIHKHENCEGVKDPKTRKSLARKYGRCFVCLSKGHRASSCKVENKCSVCDGAHHVALCEMSPKSEGKHDEIPKPNDECKNVPNNTNVHVTTPNSNLHAGTGSLVALQTARGVLRGKGWLRCGSSLTREVIVPLLLPKQLVSRIPGYRRELLGINTFGQKCVKAEHREVVELKLEPLNGNKVITLEAFVVPEICSIGNSHVEIARREYKHLEGPLRVQDIERAEPVQVNFVAQRLSSEDSLESNVQKLWSFEGLGISEEDKVHEEFLDEISFTGSRYSVKLPWKESHKKLPDNYANSLSRMKGSIRREAVTTKLRIVYDASSKEGKSGTSLNDCLHVGPSLNPLLYSILIRFRENRIALVGDIEKAFLNVEVDKADRDCLRFLWVNDIESDKLEIVVYRFCRVVFGVNASPFLLNATLRHHLTKYNEIDAAFVRKLQESFYVDDLVSGESTVEKTFELYDKAKTRMAQGGFRLRKWLTNSEVLRSKLEIHEKDQGSSEQSINDQETYARLSLGAVGGESKGHKVLGQVWDNHKDELKFEISKVGEKAETLSPTKRNLLSILASLFDPLGIISPLIVSAKILFQEVCNSKTGWDDSFKEEPLRKWEIWYRDLIETKEITIPRCIYQSSGRGSYVRMLTSKVRVAPLKTTSIPRLELMSARLLAQLLKSVKDSLENQVSIDNTKLWLDSMTALYWIMNNGEWKQFVRHRVNEILKLTNKEDWGHCPGVENPADIGSRGVVASQLKDNKLWWVGPDWLIRSKEEWPKFEAAAKTSTVLEEERKSSVMVVASSKELASISKVINLEDYGTAERLFRVTAWVLRFGFNARAKSKGMEKRCGELTVEELDEAENRWIKQAQAELKEAKKYAQISNSLGLMEEGGIIRCKGRLRNSELEYNTKHPIIIPKDNRLTELIVRKCHSEVHHCGVRATLGRLRTKYWVVKGRQMVKRVIGKCVTCKKLEGRAYGGRQMADLPGFRVKEAAPFSNVGVDFAGPLFVRCCTKASKKAYIALFSCCVTRAIHLELVRDLSAETFLCCMRRFAARRGMPSLIVSDNAKTFKAAERAVKKLFNQPKVKAELLTKRVTWRFNLERSPWWGGWQSEYLIGLREFHRSGNRKARSLKEGEVVVVYGEGEKRGKWKLGKVEQLILGNDSEVRGAKLRIAGKGKPVYLKRPVQKLYPLEIQARPGGNGTEGNSPSGEAEGSLHDLHERPRRAAAEISKAKTRVMLDS